MNDSAKHCAEHPKFNYKCKGCLKEYRKWHYETNKQHYKESSARRYQENKEFYLRNSTQNARKRRFGVDQLQFEQMLSLQGFQCAICSCDIDQSACVDHNHTTGKVRGLLCKKCNQGLGLFQDQKQLLLNAATYLGIYD